MPITDNGWFASSDLALRPFAINGVSFIPGIVDNDDVELVLRYVLQRVADEVEAPVTPGCWGFAFRINKNNPNEFSRHAGGIAVDFNAPAHPNGVLATGTFKLAQIAKIRSILDDLDVLCGVPAGTRVVRWGGDFTGTPDAMHFEVNVTPAQLPVLAAWARNQLEDDMPAPKDWDAQDIAVILEKIGKPLVKSIWDYGMDNAGTKAKSMLEAAGRLAKKTLGES